MGESLIIRGSGGTNTSEATATNDVVVTGYTCYVKDELVVGDIPIPTVNKKFLVPSEQIELPYGYYKGIDQISASTLSDETVATAVSSDLLASYKGWSEGILVDGSMANNGAIASSFCANASYTIPQGWHSGSGKITQALTVQGAVGITANTGNQTVCPASRWTTGDLWVWGNGNLVAGNIKNGVNIFGVWGNYTGWVDANGPSYNPCANVDVYSYHSDSEGWYQCPRWYVWNVYWKGWNYFNVRLVSSRTYSNRIWVLNTNFRTNQTSPGGNKYINGDANARFNLPCSFPEYCWSNNSPLISKKAMDATLKSNLAAWYGSGNIPVVYGDYPNYAYFNQCDEKVFWFSLS